MNTSETSGQVAVSTGGQRSRRYLNATHPLAEVASRLCEAHLGSYRRFGLGQVACGACWERAIRADERVVVELGLPPVLVADPGLVDEVAVERACRGESVGLSKAERRAAAARLLASGLTASQAGARLGMSGSAVSAAVAKLEGGVAA